jgi:hypothetical protein
MYMMSTVHIPSSNVKAKGITSRTVNPRITMMTLPPRYVSRLGASHTQTHTDTHSR